MYLLMKKIIILLSLLIILSSCFWDSDEVKKAKQDLWVIKITNIVEQDSILDKQEDIKVLEQSWDPRIKITQVSGEKLLELDPLDYKDFKSGYAKISWKTLGQVDKIIVSFSNNESDFPSDWFTLKKFKGWDTTFEYNASSKWKVLDFWVNKYRFIAYSWNEKSILELLVVVSEDDKRVLENNGNLSQFEDNKNKELINDNKWDEDSSNNELFEINILPKGWDYGDIVKLWEKSFTYSDIKWLEVNQEKFWNITCDKNEETGKYFVTELLSEKQKSWYYWNTCRDIIKWKWISFFVTRLEWDNYVYEKHYIDTQHGLYWIYELERWDGATSENLSDKNKELKATNGDFESLSVVDSLFRQITK